jgi:hypothetical protein
MEREIEGWFRKVDEILVEEDMVLDSLKQAVENNWIDQDEAEERIEAYHRGLIIPDIKGRDI